VTDSPITIGQPGYGPGARVVPQPNPRPTRLLPPTREPGIWATSEPDATRPNDDGKPAPLVLEVRLPYEDFQYNPKDREHVRDCAKKGDEALRAVLTPAQISDLTKTERECLAMAMYALCGHYWWNPKDTIMDDSLTRDARSVLDNLARMSDQRFQHACRKTPNALTERAKTAFANATAKWHEMSR
jgi:hypothetical protein